MQGLWDDLTFLRCGLRFSRPATIIQVNACIPPRGTNIAAKPPPSCERKSSILEDSRESYPSTIETPLMSSIGPEGSSYPESMHLLTQWCQRRIKASISISGHTWPHALSQDLISVHGSHTSEKVRQDTGNPSESERSVGRCFLKMYRDHAILATCRANILEVIFGDC